MVGITIEIRACFTKILIYYEMLSRFEGERVVKSKVDYSKFTVGRLMFEVLPAMPA